MFRAKILILSIAILAGAVACGETGNDSGRDIAPGESFMADASRADSLYAVDEDSTEARGILKLVNEASLEVLDESRFVGLDVRAAENIVEARSAAPIKTLQELDAIPWVGKAAFRDLFDYAYDNGYFAESVHGIDTDSRQADAILEIVNTATEEELDASEQVGLDRRAARNIVDAREEKPISTLGELDRIAYVGPSAFEDLLAYAVDQGMFETVDQVRYMNLLADEAGEFFDYESAGFGENVTPMTSDDVTEALRAHARNQTNLVEKEWEFHNPDQRFDASVDRYYRVEDDNGQLVGFVYSMSFFIDHPLFDGGGEHYYLTADLEIVEIVDWWG